MRVSLRMHNNWNIQTKEFTSPPICIYIHDLLNTKSTNFSNFYLSYVYFYSDFSKLKLKSVSNQVSNFVYTKSSFVSGAKNVENW